MTRPTQHDEGVVVRWIDRVDPRRLALLLMPLLVLASAVQPQAAPHAVVADPAPEQTRTEPAYGVTTHLALAPQPVTPAPAVAVPASYAALARHGEPRSDRRRAAPDGRPVTPAGRGEAALAALDYDWRALGYRVLFRPYEGGSLGTANRRTKLITVYVRRGQSELSLRASIAHELGHALDFEHGTADRRDAYRRIRELPSDLPWFPCSRCPDYASPAGDFAEVFAAWLAGPGDFRGRLHGPPREAQMRELAPLFEIPRSAAEAKAPTPTPTATRPPEDRGPLPAVLPPPPPRSGR